MKPTEIIDVRFDRGQVKALLENTRTPVWIPTGKISKEILRQSLLKEVKRCPSSTLVQNLKRLLKVDVDTGRAEEAGPEQSHLETSCCRSTAVSPTTDNESISHVPRYPGLQLSEGAANVVRRSAYATTVRSVGSGSLDSTWAGAADVVRRSAYASTVRSVGSGSLDSTWADDSDEDPSFDPAACDDNLDESEDDFFKNGDDQTGASTPNTTSPITPTSSQSPSATQLPDATEDPLYVCPSDKSIKRNVCPYCGKSQTKFARHLTLMHKNEPEVLRATALSPGKEKRATFAKLIHRGNFDHNSEVIRDGSGIIIPARRPPKGETLKKENMLPCDKCRGFFARKSLYRHACNKNGHERVQMRGRAILPIQGGLPSGLEELLSRMQIDEIGNICRTDQLIVEFGKRLFVKLGHEPHQHNYIREKMRELGRLLIQLRKSNPDSSLDQYIHPTKFDEVVSAARELGGLAGKQYKVPSVALKIGYSISQCAGIVKLNGIKRGDSAMVKAADDFIMLYKQDWHVHVSSRALGTLDERRWNRTQDMPTNDDVHRMQSAIENELADATAGLKDTPSIETYATLARTSLTHVMLFNRRRPGEASRLTIDDFHQRNRDVNRDIVEHLSDVEKQLCHSLMHVTIRGKRGRGVPLLLTSGMVEVLELLTISRELVGIHPKNPYIYVASTAANAPPLRGSECVREIARRADVKNITATNCRKQLATMLQLMQLNETEMDVVAQFLGHDIRIHRQYYRLPEKTIYASKVSKILLAMNKGTGDYAGSTLDQLNPMTDADDVEEMETSDEVVTCERGKTSRKAGVWKRSCEEDNESVGDGSLRPDKGSESGMRKRPLTNEAKQDAKAEVKSKQVLEKKPKKKKTVWSKKETEAVERQMSSFIKALKCPTMGECLAAMRQEPDLSRRSWKDIKYKAYNMTQKHKREMGL